MRRAARHPPAGTAGRVRRPGPDPGGGTLNAVWFALYPPVGGGRGSYAGLRERLSGIGPCHLPVLAGRDGRFTEPVPDTFDALAQDLWQQLRAAFETGGRPGDLVLFGFSMGALLATRMAEYLQAEAAGPRALVVAGCPPPHLLRGTRRSTLPDEELVADLAGHGITPGLMNNTELVRLMIPTWRADCAAIESHDRRPSVLRCPVFALGGRDDPLAAPDDVAVWTRMGGPGSTVRIVPGGHADVLNATDALTGALAEAGRSPGPAVAMVDRRESQ